MKRILLLAVLALSPAAHARQSNRYEGDFQSIAKDFGVRLGVAARNMTTGETVLFNADSLFPTASVIKLPVLVELFYRFHDRTLDPLAAVPLYDSLKKPGSGVLQFLQAGQTLKLLDIATLMIILSDNTATNYVIDQFATVHDEKLEAVNSRMRSLGLRNTKLLNRLYSFATKKKTWEAQRFGIGMSCPSDMLLLMDKLVRGQIIDSAACDSMIGIMRNQFYEEGAGRYLPFVSDSTVWIANKTGSLDERKIDVGVIGSSKGKFIYAIFCDNSKDVGELPDNKAQLAIAKVAKMFFDLWLK